MKILYCNQELIKYHIAEALVMAGLPMSTTTENLETDIKALEAAVFGYAYIGQINEGERITAHMNRGPKLGRAKAGSGHDCFLKGIVVTAVISAPSYQWPQIQRYHFLDIISSQSKMHRLTKMNLKDQCNEEVDDCIIDLLNSYIDDYNDKIDYIKTLKAEGASPNVIRNAEAWAHKVFRKILNNCPQGLHLAAGIVTNYLQLKTMYNQRKNHKLEEWHDDFIDWVEGLPFFKEFTGV